MMGEVWQMGRRYPDMRAYQTRPTLHKAKVLCQISRAAEQRKGSTRIKGGDELHQMSQPVERRDLLQQCIYGNGRG